MESLGSFEVFIIALILLLLAGARRLPKLLDSLEESTRAFFGDVFDDYVAERSSARPERCVSCTSASARELRCRSCGRITRKGGYLILAGLVLLGALAVWWHFAVPVL